MNINGKHHHTIWVNETNPALIQVFDQRYFPHKIEVFDISTTNEAVYAIKDMVVRGAPLIGVTAAYAMYLGCLEAKSQPRPQEYLKKVAEKLNATRPTAVNLAWAITEMARSEMSARLPIGVATRWRPGASLDESSSLSSVLTRSMSRWD